MTDTATDIDYAAVFEDLSILNRLYGGVSPNPLLSPMRFQILDSPTDYVVIRGLHTGVYYMAERIFTMGEKVFTKFALAEPRERTVTDWVWI
jgi:hypothetical protein